MKLFIRCIGAISLFISTAAIAVDLSADHKSAPPRSAQQSLEGAWVLYTIYENDEGGEDVDQFDIDPHGELLFDSKGHFSFAIFGSAAKFRSGNRLQGNRLEIDAMAKLNLSYYGTYQVDDANNTLMLRIVRCSFANWNGSVRSTSIAISGNRLEFTATGSDTPTGAYYSHSVWTRTK
jgi:hypothetical protein